MTSCLLWRSISSRIAGNKADLQFLTTNGGASSTRMIINEAGNIGIGKTNPNCKLYIATGDGNVAGN